MTNPALGIKRTCPQCNANFYDLNKSPAICPKCNHSFNPALQVKAKKKVVKRTAKEETGLAEKVELAVKKAESQKKKKSREDSDDAAHDIEEMDELDGLDDIEGLSELDGAETEQLVEDDTDDKTIIEDIGDTGETLVDNIEEEEAQALVEEIEDERVETKKPAKKKPSK